MRPLSFTPFGAEIDAMAIQRVGEMKIFETIVVGGGIIGTCTAAMLSELGVEVLLIDSDTCASRGASAFSGGIIRFYDADPVMMHLNALADKILRERNVGRVFEKSVRRSGILYRAPMTESQRIKDSMLEVGYPDDHWSLLSHSQLKKLTDFVLPDPSKLDLFEKKGGFSNVRFATHSLAHLVREAAQMLEHTRVKSLGQTDSEIAEIQLENGSTLYSRIVVIAMGAWIGQLLRGAPIEARTIPLALFGIDSAPPFPVIDICEGTYAVPLGTTIIGVGCGPRATAPIPEMLPPLSRIHEADGFSKLNALAGREKAASPLGILRGFDSYSPDNRPILGFIEASSSIYAMSGFGGLGFKIAPAVAEIAASQILARLRQHSPPDLEVAHSLSPQRIWTPTLSKVQEA